MSKWISVAYLLNLLSLRRGGVLTEHDIVTAPYATFKWIPASERLPEIGKVVLVCGSRGGIYTAIYKGSRYWYKLNSKSHFCEPTHWMPLPEPPKEDLDG